MKNEGKAKFWVGLLPLNSLELPAGSRETNTGELGRNGRGPGPLPAVHGAEIDVSRAILLCLRVGQGVADSAVLDERGRAVELHRRGGRSGDQGGLRGGRCAADGHFCAVLADIRLYAFLPAPAVENREAVGGDARALRGDSGGSGRSLLNATCGLATVGATGEGELADVRDVNNLLRAWGHRRDRDTEVVVLAQVAVGNRSRLCLDIDDGRSARRWCVSDAVDIGYHYPKQHHHCHREKADRQNDGLSVVMLCVSHLNSCPSCSARFGRSI